MDKSTHQIRCEQWTRIINNYLASGQTKKDWCRDNGISEKSFYYWQRILRNEAYLEQKQLPSPVSQVNKAPVTFVELKPPVPEPDKGACFHPDVIIRNRNITLEISNTASTELLKQLGGLLHAQ